MDQKYCNKKKKSLYERICLLSKTEHEEIYKILKVYNMSNVQRINFSYNKNGIFFNLSGIEDSLFEQLENFVNYCINNQKDLDDYDKKINECKINNNFNNIIHINFETMPKETELIRKQNAETEDWNQVLTDAKSIQRVSHYVEKLMSDRDRIGRKKVNAKFNNAKKKFGKKIYGSEIGKKFEVDELQLENYIIST